MVLGLAGAAATATAAEAAGKPAKPRSVLVTADVDGTDAEITVTAGYKTRDVQSAECSVDGNEVACGEPTSSGKNASSYSVSLTNLPSGEHDFVITLTLARKGTTVSGSTTFETVGEPVDLETACVAYGGTYSANGPLANQCLKEYASHADAEADFANFFATLRPACQGDAYLGGGLDAGATIDLDCATEQHLQMLALCEGVDGSSNSGVDVVSCQTPDSGVREPFRALCWEAGGYYFDVEVADPDAYVCLAALDDPETTCTEAGGTYAVVNALSWTCTKTYATPEDLDADLATFTDSLDVACDQRVTYGRSLTETSVSYGCGNDTVTRLNNLCESTDPVQVGASRDEFTCQTADGSIAAPFEAICTEAGASYRVTDSTPPTYVCEDPVTSG